MIFQQHSLIFRCKTNYPQTQGLAARASVHLQVLIGLQSYEVWLSRALWPGASHGLRSSQSSARKHPTSDSLAWLWAAFRGCWPEATLTKHLVTGACLSHRAACSMKCTSLEGRERTPARQKSSLRDPNPIASAVFRSLEASALKGRRIHKRVNTKGGVTGSHVRGHLAQAPFLEVLSCEKQGPVAPSRPQREGRHGEAGL